MVKVSGCNLVDPIMTRMLFMDGDRLTPSKLLFMLILFIRTTV